MKKGAVIFQTGSYHETFDLGRTLGTLVAEGDVLALEGELGSGKTCFAKGLAQGLGVSPEMVVTSPSFALVNEYEGRRTLFHIDAYRLENLSDFVSAGLDEYFYEGGVVVMEWADRWPEILPEQTMRISFVITGEDTREITLGGDHPRVSGILRELTKITEGK